MHTKRGSGRNHHHLILIVAPMAENHPTKTNLEQRDYPRFPHEAAIMFENYATGNYYEGRMANYSRTGIYFETDFAPAPGAEIFIGIEDSPFSNGHDVYRAKVIWCKNIKHRRSYYYGVGAKFY